MIVANNHFHADNINWVVLQITVLLLLGIDIQPNANHDLFVMRQAGHTEQIH